MPEGLAGDAGLVAAGGTVAVALMKVVEGVLARRQTPQQKDQTDTKTVAEAVAEAVPALSEAWRQMNDGMRSDFDALRAHVDRLTAKHDECEARCDRLNGVVREQEQRIDSLLRQLRDPASTAPGGPLRAVVVELSGGDALTLPDHSEDKP